MIVLERPNFDTSFDALCFRTEQFHNFGSAVHTAGRLHIHYYGVRWHSDET
jgi:hypothetical protein